jgi:hypothetical protein
MQAKSPTNITTHYLIQGLGQRLHRRETAVTQLPDPIHQPLDQWLTLFLGSVLDVEQSAERLFGLVEDPNGRMGIEVAVQPKLLVSKRKNYNIIWSTERGRIWTLLRRYNPSGEY